MEQTPQRPATEAERNLDPELLTNIRRMANLIELIHDVAQMRYYQKAFFKERENEKLKREYLTKSKEYERRVDNLIAALSPKSSNSSNQSKQSNLFQP